MKYWQKEELRKEYSMINDIMNMKEFPYKKRLKCAENFKKLLREKLKRYNNREDNIHYSEDGERCWWKEYFDESFTEEEKKEFIKDRWVHIYSPYDCTGQWFTSHIVVCNVETSFGAKSVAYFFMGLDV